MPHHALIIENGTFRTRRSAHITYYSAVSIERSSRDIFDTGEDMK